MTEAKRDTPDIWQAYYCCREASENFHAQYIKHGREFPGYLSIYEQQGRDFLAAAAAALGYRLVEIEPVPITSEPGFDGRDGGRMHEISSAQEA